MLSKENAYLIWKTVIFEAVYKKKILYHVWNSYIFNFVFFTSIGKEGSCGAEDPQEGVGGQRARAQASAGKGRITGFLIHIWE